MKLHMKQDLQGNIVTGIPSDAAIGERHSMMEVVDMVVILSFVWDIITTWDMLRSAVGMTHSWRSDL